MVKRLLGLTDHAFDLLPAFVLIALMISAASPFVVTFD